jgi:glutathionylspermidine synthase
MKRISDALVRDDWHQLILDQGLLYSPTEEPNGSIMQYWRENAYYSFTLAEIEYMERVAAVLFEMCIEAGDYIVARPHIMNKLGIPKWAQVQVVKTWNEEPACQSVYGRFDIRFGGLDHPDPALRIPQLYEFNADTPTSLLESAWIQWKWLESTAQGTDQWNSIWERLVEAWKRNLALVAHKLGHKPIVGFACSSDEASGEDILNTTYLENACVEAGYQTKRIFVEDIVLGDDGRFYYDTECTQHIDVIFKLYPWEYMVGEKFGKACFRDMDSVGLRNGDGSRYIGGTIWIEPPYKMLWSNKGLLAVLWKMFKDQPEKAQYLIPAWFEGEEPKRVRAQGYVRKPLLGREGANVTIYRDGEAIQEVPGEYGEEGWVVQAFAPLPDFVEPTTDGTVAHHHPVLGIWMIDGEPAGLGIRESDGFVTDNLSNFVAHSIVDNPTGLIPSEPAGVAGTVTFSNPPNVTPDMVEPVQVRSQVSAPFSSVPMFENYPGGPR